MSSLNSPFQHCTGELTNEIRQENAIKVIQIGNKNVKLSLVSDNSFVYTENQKKKKRTKTLVARFQDTMLIYRNQSFSCIIGYCFLMF